MSEARLIGMCGILCSECGAYLATKSGDEALRRKTAEEWSVQYGVALKPEDIYCVGCTVLEGPHIGHCSECGVRSCGLGRKLANFGRCPEYGCATITGFFNMVPEAKTVLDAEHTNA
jgi:hypothetical protein